jgi:hypothetical protein
MFRRGVTLSMEQFDVSRSAGGQRRLKATKALALGCMPASDLHQR